MLADPNPVLGLGSTNDSPVMGHGLGHEYPIIVQWCVKGGLEKGPVVNNNAVRRLVIVY